MTHAFPEGYVKFEVAWARAPAPEDPELAALDARRTRLHDLGLIGVLPDGIGYGNLSLRTGPGDTFVITGTATGRARVLGPGGYTRVTAFDLDRNRVECAGPVKASAETLSHGAIYLADPRIRCVAHGHHRALWEHGLQAGWPRTPPEAEYGTPAMARALRDLARFLPDPTRGLLIMTGHQDGIIAFGPDLDTPARLLESALAETA